MNAPNPTPLTFAEFLTAARVARKWQQKDLSVRLGVVPAYISRMEKGFSLPSDDLLVVICGLFGWDSAEMWLLVQIEKCSCPEIAKNLELLLGAWRHALAGQEGK